jgi:outer membrane protein insertion porin family
MRWIFRAALLCSCAFVIGAQEAEQKAAPKKEPPPGTLHSVTVKGNRLYSAQEITKESGLKVGQRITGPIIEQARKKLESTELFISIADEYHYTPGLPPGYDVTFQVTENEQLFPMRFERLGVSDEAVRQYLRDHVDMYSDRIPGTAVVLHRYTSAVEAFVRQSNPSFKVKATISNDDPQQLAVVFASDVPAPTISQVVVTGNEAVDTGTILRAVNQVAIGVPLSDTRLKQILDGTIKPVYAAKGYAAVTFPNVEVEPAKTNLGVVVKVQIKDGPPFKFGSIRFHGSGMDEQEIRSAIPFKPGQPFNGDQVENFRIDLMRRMKRRGYLDAGVHTQADTDDSKRLVNITYDVVPGAVYNFQKLDIQGLDVTTEPVVAKLWGEKPGKPFNPEYPDFFLKRVQQQGLFDNLADTHSDYSTDPSTHDVTVHLYFKGGKSAQDKARQKQEEEERRKADGTWNPYPQLRMSPQ